MKRKQVLSIQHRTNADVHILDLEGKFRANMEGIFWNAVQSAVVEQGARKLLLNFEKVVECDSFGISEILRAQNSMEYLRGQLIVIGINDLVRKVLTITKVVNVLHIRADESTALAEMIDTSPQPTA